jgi:hypothetical protein
MFSPVDQDSRLSTGRYKFRRCLLPAELCLRTLVYLQITDWASSDKFTLISIVYELWRGCLPRTIFPLPVLEPDGSNWVAWNTRPQFSMATKGTLGHLTCTAIAPTTPGPVATSSAAPNPAAPVPEPPIPADIAAHEAAVAAYAKWQETEYLARWQLTRAVKDVALQRVISKSSVSEMWKAIQADFKYKYSLVQADPQKTYHMLQCSEREDVRTHLDEIQSLRAELAAAGVVISHKEQVSVIMTSLPRAYISEIKEVLKIGKTWLWRFIPVYTYLNTSSASHYFTDVWTPPLQYCRLGPPYRHKNILFCCRFLCARGAQAA